MSIQDYINEVQTKWQTGIAREHAYRPVLENLLKKLLPGLTALNDPARIHVGTLDFIVRKGEVDVGYIEAKDVNVNLDKVEKSEQLKRYLDLDNLILTDYLEFRFYREGVKIDTVRIGDAMTGQVIPRPENFEKLKILLEEFGAFKGQTIRSSQKLAEMMARKARLMREVFHEALNRDEPSSLKDQCKAFKDILMHDLDEKQFSDIYAQTITYGLFTARLHDPTLEDFSRAEAQGLIPKSNPFLRQLFFYVTGPDLDPRVVWIVDDLCNLFQATNVRKIFEDYGKSTRQTDPVLHFYENFLGAYDKNIKDMRGVWFTPEPVVHFIVRAIDDVLKSHFGVKDGIADNSKIEIELDTQTRDDRSATGYRKVKKEVHKVQLLDVATGTGTFLAEVVKQIYPRFNGMEGIWSSYIENDLLPRLHGFELLMASYAMCHMKLDLLLSELGYKPSDPDKPPRVSVYLTNSLEEHHPDADTLFASWLSREANEASRIKRDMPIMVAFGNPPYNGKSKNNGDHIIGLMDAYKKEPGGKVKLKEKNSKWINNDYMKFIRMGEHYIERNGEGILAYITSHSYLDSTTFRGMRWHLLNTFDDIYVLDLHGNSVKKETAPDGSADINVFDIKEGVAIIIAVKKKQKGRKKLATVHHADLYGKRAKKYDFLYENTIQSIKWNELNYCDPAFLFIPQDYRRVGEYKEYFAINNFFVEGTMGVTSGKDPERVSFEKTRSEFSKPYSYRPFDIRYIDYNPKILARAREATMRHLAQENIALISCKINRDDSFTFYLCDEIADKSLVSSLDNSFCYPLYRYEAVMGDVEQKVPNFDPAIYAKIKDAVPDVMPESLFDYIYAVLHAPAYRELYAEFLKSDFPRIPYPSDPATFYALAEKGTAIRELHLLESPLLDGTDVTYPVSGDNKVDKPDFKNGKVWINKDQYFDGVSQTAWEFYIGGYQPAQKWLKDRKGRTLTMDDIQHYRKIIKALSETARLMQDIDQIDFLPKNSA